MQLVNNHSREAESTQIHLPGCAAEDESQAWDVTQFQTHSGALRVIDRSIHEDSLMKVIVFKMNPSAAAKIRGRICLVSLRFVGC